MGRSNAVRLVLWLSFVLLFSCTFWGQVTTGSLHGQVTDPSGAVIPQAEVSVVSSSGQTFTAISDGQGFYDFKNLPSGNYSVTASAKGFATFQQNAAVVAGATQKLNIALQILVEKQQVEVQEQTTQVDTTASNNASAIVLKGKDLEALSDDPDELQSELDALAGPSAGPNGGQIYIDGFTGGQLPPKSAIREIRVNQNPFSAQYDRLGYGRIEILTKPGSDKFHGQFYFNVNNSVFNSTNPFVGVEPGYQTDQYSGSIGGPLGKKASFFFNAERRNINDVAVVSSSVRDVLPDGSTIPAYLENPRTRTNISPRIDYQLTNSNTLTVRYQFTQRNDTNDLGSTQTALPTQAYNVSNTENTIQISDTQILSSRVVNETHFEFERDGYQTTAQNGTPTLNVVGLLSAGGYPNGNLYDTENHYELQNYTSVQLNKHFLKFGGRMRVASIADATTSGFNGTFTFSTLDDYLAGTPTQFSVTVGQPLANLNYVDAGLYAEDDWRARSNLTISYGLRFETQNGIHDHGDFAPRIGLAWGLSRGKNTPKTVLRAGFGMFYDRFDQGLMLQTAWLNGNTQREYIVNSPAAVASFYPNIPTEAQLQAMGVEAAVYSSSRNLRAPYTMQTAVAIERQIGKNATASVTYVNSRGVHQFFSDNINAPEPGTYDPANPATAVYPNGTSSPDFQYESEGIFKQNQLIANSSVRVGQKISLFGFYTLSYANSNTDGASSFPVDQYDLAANYGRAAFDVRHRAAMGGSIALRYAIRFSPFILASSGVPFNITYGDDLNGDSVFNDRPVFATASGPNTKVTPWGIFNTSSGAAGVLIPRNLGTGPGQFSFNMRLSKTIGFGRIQEGGGVVGGGGGGHMHGPPGIAGRGLSGGGGPRGFGPETTNHRYNVTVSANVRNLFNNVNRGVPVGNIDSLSFGKSITLANSFFSGPAAVRRLDFQVMFAF